ncbi:TATA box-binding protein-associated factor RNA polymerase I subunit C, partial [Coemansia spiralis]
MGSVSKAFPATAWPLNRSEAGIGHAALAPAGLGGAVALIPTLSPVQFRADGAAGASWHPAAVQHGLRTYGQLSEPRAPVTLRPPTQIPGFLAQDTSPSHSHMVYNFRRAHGDLDIPHELLASEFRDAEAAGSWGGLPAIKGGTVAICRPALGEQQPEHPPPATRARADAAEDGLAVLRHEMNVDPVLSGRSTRGTGSELARAPLWSSRREWAMYAGGECGNELWALPLPSADDVVQGFPSLQRRDIDAVAEATVGPSIEFTTPIRQVVARAAHPGFVCVRTDSMVATVALSQCHWGAEWAPNVDADVAGHPYSYDSGDRWTCHVSWSPWRAAETALASGTGTVRLWDCIASCETMLKDADQAGDYDIQWNCCEYWSSPRQLLCANPDTLYCLDARAGRTQTAIMTLRDSPFASSGEVFTAVCPSALHPLHAVAASSHAIRVFDQRYLRQPVMAWALGSTPADPPIYLQSELLPGSAAGHAACIFAATEKSSRVYGYVYGQGGSDQPYTSLDQFMLRPGSHTSPGHEAIQDALAVDPQSNEDMTSAYTHVSEYPTARLAGFAFHCLDTAADTAGGGPVVDAV